MKRLSRALLRVALAGGAIALPISALASSHVEAVLSVPSTRDPAHPAIVVLELRNTGNEPVSVLKWNTPFVLSGGRLPKPLFVVKDEQGREIGYRGTYVNFAGVTMDAFIVLAPGEVRRKELDLIQEYRYGNGGNFEVTYTLNLDQSPDPFMTSEAERRAFHPASQKQIQSNAVTIQIAGPVDSLAKVQANEDDLVCSPHQRNVISGAQFAATRPVIAARDFMFFQFKPQLGDDGRYHYVFESHPRYTRWFGSHDPSESSFGDPGWGGGNTAQVYESLDALASRLLRARRGDGSLVAKCGCPGFDPRTAAHPVVDTTYVMYFCQRFFELPVEDPYASQVGVLAHEYSHYNDIFPGRADYVYGRQNAEKLATDDPFKAVRNADNFEYFILDKRPYPPVGSR